MAVVSNVDGVAYWNNGILNFDGIESIDEEARKANDILRDAQLPAYAVLRLFSDWGRLRHAYM